VVSVVLTRSFLFFVLSSWSLSRSITNFPFPIGVTNIEHVAVDLSGNQQSCGSRVTVTQVGDFRAPVCSNCPNNTQTFVITTEPGKSTGR
jgi:hypothetical protein